MGTLPLTCPCCATKEVWAHLSHTKGKLPFPSFILPRAVAVHSPHEAKSFGILLFLCVWCCLRVWASKYEWPVKFVFVYKAVGEKVRTGLCALAVWRLGENVILRWFLLCIFHLTLPQQKSIPPYCTTCSACMYWAEVVWTSVMADAHTLPCCMNTICRCPVRTPSINLHCFHIPTRREPIWSHSVSDF